MEFRYHLLPYLILCLCNLSNAEQNNEPLIIRTFDPPNDCILPKELQNYKLQVLEKTKSIDIKVNGGVVQTSIPIFIYVPKSNIQDGTELIKKGMLNLERISKMSEWSQEDVSSILNLLKQGVLIIGDKPNQ
jgi:hypothetical protein